MPDKMVRAIGRCAARGRVWRAAPLFIKAAALLLVAASCVPKPEPKETGSASAYVEQRGEQDQTVTVITVQDLVSKVHQARGQMVVVNFWATWCPPCIEEMPELAQFYRSLNVPGNSREKTEVTFLSVSADDPDTVESRVKPLVKEHTLPFPVYVVDTKSPEEVSKALGVDWEGGLPATFVFNAHGTLQKEWSEGVTAKELLQIVGKSSQGAAPSQEGIEQPRRRPASGLRRVA